MKHLLLIITLSIFAFAANAQIKTVKKDVKQEVKQPTDTVTIDVSKVRFVKIGNQVHDFNSEIPLFVSFQYIISVYDVLDNAKSGLSKKEIESLQSPLVPYWQAYQRQTQKK